MQSGGANLGVRSPAHSILAVFAAVYFVWFGSLPLSVLYVRVCVCVYVFFLFGAIGLLGLLLGSLALGRNWSSAYSVV